MGNSASRNAGTTNARTEAEPLAPVAEELITNLLNQLERVEERAANYQIRLVAAQKQIKADAETMGYLYDALAPFAAIAEPIHASWDGERRINTLSVEPIRVRHLRRAAALCALRGSGSTSVAPQVSQPIREAK